MLFCLRQGLLEISLIARDQPNRPAGEDVQARQLVSKERRSASIKGSPHFSVSSLPHADVQPHKGSARQQLDGGFTFGFCPRRATDEYLFHSSIDDVSRGLSCPLQQLPTQRMARALLEGSGDGVGTLSLYQHDLPRVDPPGEERSCRNDSACRFGDTSESHSDYEIKTSTKTQRNQLCLSAASLNRRC